MRFKSIRPLVYFSFYRIDRNATLALSGVKPPARNNVTKSPIGGVIPQSDRIIHVGNLNWAVPIEDVSQMITKAVGPLDIADIKFVQLSLPRRKRDEGKYHGGSARVAFRTTKEATMAMQALQAFSDSNMNAKELRLRWATISKRPKDSNNKVEELSVEQIQHRKDRAESYARRRQRVAQKTDEVITLLVQQNVDRIITIPVLDAPRLDWSQCPEEIDPMKGGGIRKGTARGERKQAAVEAFLFVVKAALLEDNDRITLQQRFIADLGCGAGNLSIPLAWWLQKQGFGVLGIDINGQALDRLEKRASRAEIPIETLEKDLLVLLSLNSDELSKDERHPLADCVAVVSLHACGAASDLSMETAITNNLPFAISPCCIGKVNTSRLPGRMPSLSSGERSAAPPEISYPRSTWLSESVSLNEYQMLAAAADYGVGNSKEELDEQELARRRRCRIAKQIIETDRLQWAEEKGYFIRMVEMPRIGPLYPKRELLLGAKKGSSAASRISQLPTVRV